MAQSAGGFVPKYTLKSIPQKIKKYVEVYGWKETVHTLKGFATYEWLKRFEKGLVKRKIHHYEMYLDSLDPGLSRELIIKGDREQQLREVIHEVLKPGNNVLDLGANIGYYSLMMAKIIGSEGKIYALEPSPTNVVLLKKNLALNGYDSSRVEVFPYAGSNEEKTEKLYISEYSNLNTMVPKDLKLNRTTPGTSEKFVEVRGVKISDFIQDKKPIDFLRMDIEGYEVEVLQGLRDAVAAGKFKGTICFEVHTPKYDDQKRNMRAELEFLKSHGYQVRIITSNREERVPFKKKGYQPDRVVRTRLEETRGIYYNMKMDDAIDFVCDLGGVRDLILEKK